MIITIPRPYETILNNIKGYKKIFIVGCAQCASKCRTGDEESVKLLADMLQKSEKEVTGYAVLDTPCDIRISKRDLKVLKDNKSDAVIVLACGAGAGGVEKATDLPIFPGLDPVFTGTTEHIGTYHEFCAICGDCMLDQTGGICPVTRCIKGLVNGPCGGYSNGKCEADPESDCAWVLIYDKMKNRKDKGILEDIVAPKKRFKPHRIKKEKNNG